MQIEGMAVQTGNQSKEVSPLPMPRPQSTPIFYCRWGILHLRWNHMSTCKSKPDHAIFAGKLWPCIVGVVQLKDFRAFEGESSFFYWWCLQTWCTGCNICHSTLAWSFGDREERSKFEKRSNQLTMNKILVKWIMSPIIMILLCRPPLPSLF